MFSHLQVEFMDPYVKLVGAHLIQIVDVLLPSLTWEFRTMKYKFKLYFEIKHDM